MKSFHNIGLFVLLLLFLKTADVFCWSSEDLELFDLVESSSQKFYDVLGVDQKASPSDIRKAYRRLSTLYHPDKNKSPDAEETFRKIAAIADVLRNEERRKKYDLILQTGLPDWREPIYYYRRVRNMGLIELMIFLFCLATVGQYLFAWSVYWERKYEIEEVVLSRLKKKAKNQRKSKGLKAEDDLAATEEMCSIPKPKYQDLFPVQLVYFFIHLIKSTPSYLKSCLESLHCPNVEQAVEEEDDDDEPQEVRQKIRKHVKPQYPDFSNIQEAYDASQMGSSEKLNSDGCSDDYKNQTKILSEADLNEFKKAMKKFPNGTLQRWEKISDYLSCSVHEVVSMAKQMKSQQFTRNIPISLQGVTGFEKGNAESEDHLMHQEKSLAELTTQNGSKPVNGNCCDWVSDGGTKIEKTWKQEEQRVLELALIKFPKDTTARWDHIADFVQSKTKEECMIRYKELAQQVKKKKYRET